MRVLLGLLVLVLAGCSPEPAPRRAQSALSVEPTSRSFNFPDGRLVMMEVPVQAGRRVEMQRCFLWKSERTEQLQCPGEALDAPAIRLPEEESAAARY